MNKHNTNKYFFSLILPLSRNAPFVKVKKCINSIESQLEKDYEFIIVADNSWKYKLKKYKIVKFIGHDISKTEARNLGSKKSCGKYLIHIDHDIYFLPNTLSILKREIVKSKAKALNVPFNIVGNSYMNKVYKLEYEFTRKRDLYKGFPVIERNLFNKIKGFDQELNILDDFSLHAKLIENKIFVKCMPRITNFDPTMSIRSRIKRKIIRGQYLPILKFLYPL